LKLKDALELEEAKHLRKMEIRTTKGHDYANEDCLANFKCRGELYKVLDKWGMSVDVTTASGVALDAVFLKILRILNLRADNKTAMNESEDDTWLDLSNYVDLAHECRLDEIAETTIDIRAGYHFRCKDCGQYDCICDEQYMKLMEK